MTFGHKLKGLRGARVVSQRALAALLDMDTAYLSRIENDMPNHLPSVLTIQRIVKVLDLKTPEADELYVLANKLPPDVDRTDGLGIYVEVDSRNSTRTCSACGALTGPQGWAGLSVREWDCGACGAHHDRDTNAAMNALIAGAGLAHEMSVRAA